MGLTKRESMYRQKLINEKHWNKDEQKDLDNYIKTSRFQDTYCKLYKTYRAGIEISFVPEQSLRRIEKAFKKCGISIRDMGKQFRATSDVLNDLAKVWQNNNFKMEEEI